MEENKNKEETPCQEVAEPFFGLDESSTTSYIQTTAITDCSLTTTDCSTSTVSYTTYNTNDLFLISDGSSNLIYNDPYAELEEFKQEQEAEEKLREENPSLQEAYEEYQLIKKLVQDEECDKFFDDKMRTFKI